MEPSSNTEGALAAAVRRLEDKMDGMQLHVLQTEKRVSFHTDGGQSGSRGFPPRRAVRTMTPPRINAYTMENRGRETAHGRGKIFNFSTTCQKCGRSPGHLAESCPARGKLCRKCNRPNHFARVCFTAKPQGSSGNR